MFRIRRRQILKSALLVRGLAASTPFIPMRAAAQRAAAPPKRRMLQQRFTGETIRAALLRREAWTPWPRHSARSAWEALPAEVGKSLIAAGERAGEQPWPALPATLFLEFKRVGNRARYEAASFARRNMLRDLVLAECAEGKGRFLDAIANGIWTICEETYWGIPAHVNLQKAGVDLPDVEEPTVDLFAAETGSLLAWTNYLIGEQFAQVSALLPRRISGEIDRRILKPNAERIDFWWMGLDPSLQRAMNNWNPWINSNWLVCNLLEERDASRRAESTHKIVRSLDRFLDAYDSDGGCDEGPGYWGHAGGSLFDCLELLHTGSAGKLNAYDMPLVREIGRYIYRAHIAGDYFLNFADASAKVRVDSDLVYRYGKRIEDSNLQALASYAFQTRGEGGPGSRSILRALPSAFGYAEISATKLPAPLVRDVWLDGIQVATARKREGSAEGLYLAVKGGHNAESHNHNDVGNFVIYLNGQPAIIDVGVETYSAKTFSSRRYEIWTMQSAYHNLPTIHGVMQTPGLGFAARNVAYEANDAEVRFSLDIAGAYPPEARLREWNRQWTYHRANNRVRLREQYVCDIAPEELTLSLMTPCDVRQSVEGELRLTSAALGDEAFTVGFAADEFTWKLEEIAIDDARLRPVWGDRIFRILLIRRNPPARGGWDIHLQG